MLTGKTRPVASVKVIFKLGNVMKTLLTVAESRLMMTSVLGWVSVKLVDVFMLAPTNVSAFGFLLKTELVDRETMKLRGIPSGKTSVVGVVTTNLVKLSARVLPNVMPSPGVVLVGKTYVVPAATALAVQPVTLNIEVLLLFLSTTDLPLASCIVTSRS